jgi:hypothetical protein
MEWLGKAYEKRELPLILIKVDPIYENLRADPRYQDVVRRIGLPP